jgi:lipopolysaccharide/colanic/teichoic acid biosynthesis glycosyltransferase
MYSVAMRALDVVLSLIGLIVFSPVILTAMVAVWWQDGFSPFYVARRAGRGERPFDMVKLRSMVKNADRTGVASTSNTDMRITRVGHLIRRYKL